jgi:AcrR family transcriptional regulator
MAAQPITVATRREQILRVAARLFATHGFHGVSIAELGAAVGVSGPALYRHFPSKEALLGEILVAISRRLQAGGAERAARIEDPDELLESLVDFQLDFTMHEPELITVQDRDLANLAEADRHEVRALQRSYVEVWVGVLRRLRPELAEEDARVAAHAVFGLLNSTPYSAPGTDPARVAAQLRRMALAALLG